MNEHLPSLRAAYDFDAPRRATNVFDGWRIEVIDDFLGRLGAAASVLELGCGAGQAAVYINGLGHRVTAMDLSPVNVDLTARQGIDAHVGDFTDPAFHIGEFDGVLAMNSILHVKKDLFPVVLDVIRRALRPGGIALLVVWGGYNHEGTLEDEWTQPPRFFAFYSDEDFAALPTPGFRTIQCDFRHNDVEGDMHPQILLLEAV